MKRQTLRKMSIIWVLLVSLILILEFIIFPAVNTRNNNNIVAVNNGYGFENYSVPSSFNESGNVSYFPTAHSNASIEQKNNRISHMLMEVNGGLDFWNSPHNISQGQLEISFDISINAKLQQGLYPSSLKLILNVTGNNTNNTDTLTPLPILENRQNANVSIKYDGSFGLVGIGSTNKSLSFYNEDKYSAFNFSLNTAINAYLSWPGNSDNYTISVVLGIGSIKITDLVTINIQKEAKG